MKIRHDDTLRTHHGHTFTDPFEWMRDKTSPEVIDYLNAQNELTDTTLAHLSDLREDIVAEIASRTKEDDTSAPVKRGAYWYYKRTFEGKDYPAYYRVASEERPEVPAENAQLLFDGNVLADGCEFFSVSQWEVSPNDAYVALGVDRAGDERYTILVLDIATGEVVDDSVTDAGYGLVWAADSESFYYGRVDEAWRSCAMWSHDIGDDPAEDTLIYHEDDDRFWMVGEASRCGQWLILHSASKSTAEVRLMPTDGSAAPFVVCPRRTGLDYTVEIAGDEMLIFHNAANEDFEVAVAPIGPSSPKRWTTILSPGPGERISEVAAFSSFAAVAMRSDGGTQIRIIPHMTSGWGEPFAVPSTGTVEIGANWEYDTITLRYTETSIVTPVVTKEFDVSSREVSIVQETEVPNYDPARYVQRREWAITRDGTRVPITLAYRTDVRADGTNPVLLYGYGAYEATVDPYFHPDKISLLDRGIIYAIAHIRGGGEMGRAWYDHGKMLEKKNSFTDFIDCASFLVESGWAGEGRVAAFGGSAGGLLMGAVANMSPQSFAAIVAAVPFVDALTTILDPSLPLTVPEWEEWGNPLEDQEVYEYMASYSPYENVEAKTYPPILATTSLNDTRVFYVEPAKWIAKLQETADGGPFLMKTEMVAGHGGPSGRYANWAERAFHLSFIMDHLDAKSLLDNQK